MENANDSAAVGPPLDADTFIKGLVARLVVAGTRYIQPGAACDRRGSGCILDGLDRRIERARGTESRARYKALVRLRAELSPSSTGVFTAIDFALRRLQLTLTARQAWPDGSIALTVSRPFAAAMLAELPSASRSVIDDAAEHFLSGRALAA